MKKKIASLLIIIFYFLITSFSQSSYNITDKDFDFKKFPLVTFKLWSRSITEIDTNKIILKEKGNPISSFSYKLIKDSSKTISKNKILFILIENHYLAKGINERAFFKDVLINALNGNIKQGDKIFIGTFDWYRNNKYLFLLNNSPLDDENQIFSLINNISSPPKLQNQQVGADIYFALDETIKFLAQIKDSLPKNILLLSDDFPNIAGQKTVDEIRKESLKFDIPIYAIGYNVGADRYSQITKDDICIPTNGNYFSTINNNRKDCSKKVREFLVNMNTNSLGKTYLISFTSKEKKAGQKIPVSIETNEKKLAESLVKYPFNLLEWISVNIILFVFILLSIIAILFSLYFLIKRNKKLKMQSQIEEKEKQLQIKNAANEIQRLKQQQEQQQSQQLSNEQKLHEQTKKIEEETKLEKLKQLMKAKSLIPRINYDYNGQKGQFYIDSPKFTIGRDEKSNSFFISSPSVSRNHAEIQFNENGQFLIKDLNSTNGVLVNGVKEKLIILKHGDNINLGDVKLKVNL